jgi:site-specific recombinase XerD
MPTVYRATRHYIAARKQAGEWNSLTAVTSGSILSRFAREVGEDLDLSRLRRKHVERWLASRHVATGTLRLELSTVKNFTRWCVVRGWMKHDPAQEIRGPRTPRAVPRHLPKGVLETTLAVADDRARLILLLMAHLGLRRAEVAWLQHGDFEDELVRIHGKGGHERVLPITVEVREALDAYLARYPASNGPLIRSYLYPNRGISPARVGEVVADVFREAGVKQPRGRDGISAHPARHLCAVELLDRGVDIRLVQHTLGHARLSTTSIYVQRRMATAELRAALEGRRYGGEPGRSAPAG